MSLPKILICVDWFAPGYKAGGPIQSCVNFARAMSDSHEIYILTTDRDAGDTAAYANIKTDEWLDFDTNIKVYYIGLAQLNYGTIKREIQGITPQFLYLNSLYSLYFTIMPLWIISVNNITTKLVLSPRGMLKASALQFKKYKKIPFIYILKYTGIIKNVTFHATDEQEKNDITAYFGNKTKIAVVNNFPKLTHQPLRFVEKKEQTLRLFYLSRIHPIKKLDFCIAILQQVPNHLFIEFDIYGNVEDQNYWASCQAAIARLPANITVTYQGEVENSRVVEIGAAYHLFILPTSGENFGHAIWEALLANRPVLISDQTPWRNLAAKNIGYDLPLSAENAWVDALSIAADWSQADFDDICKNIAIFAQNYIKNNNTKNQYNVLFS